MRRREQDVMSSGFSFLELSRLPRPFIFSSECVIVSTEGLLQTIKLEMVVPVDVLDRWLSLSGKQRFLRAPLHIPYFAVRPASEQCETFMSYRVATM